jgi:hypothetical protein
MKEKNAPKWRQIRWNKNNVFFVIFEKNAFYNTFDHPKLIRAGLK